MLRAPVYIFPEDNIGVDKGKFLKVRFTDPRNKTIVDTSLRFYKTEDDHYSAEYAGMIIKLTSEFQEERRVQVKELSLYLLWNGSYRDIKVRGIIGEYAVTGDGLAVPNDPITIECYGNNVGNRFFRIMSFLCPREGKRICELAPFFRQTLIIPGVLKNVNKGYASMVNGVRFYLPEPLSQVERFDCLTTFFSEGKMVKEWIELCAIECDYCRTNRFKSESGKAVNH